MFQSKKLQLIVYLVSYLSLIAVTGFNISPKPNLVFKETTPRYNQNNSRSSYFGLSINLRKNSIIVGAPRAQPNIESQRNINETGAIYKCYFKTKECDPFVFDKLGNDINNSNTEFTAELKDMQLLGVAIDGGTNDTDKLVVCAPWQQTSAEGIPWMSSGICYWTSETSESQPSNVTKITSHRSRGGMHLEKKDKNGKKGQSLNFFFNSEMGHSVHVTENNEEIIIGAPGMLHCSGSIVRYYLKDGKYTSDIPQPMKKASKYLQDSYLGFAVTSGNFDSRNREHLIYVASAPRGLLDGMVYFFDIRNNKKILIKIDEFSSRKYGEYFGYSLLSEDFNGDKLLDLAISAPFYSTDGWFDHGAVYIYLNQGNVRDPTKRMKHKQTLTSGNSLPGHFGTTLSKLGDINGDGYNDIAIGAPFEGNGAVYIFLGSAKGLHGEPSQILRSPIDQVNIQSMFGHGISKGVDIDFNGYNELAIGAPNSKTVYLYKTYPVVKINASTHSPNPSIDQNNFKIRVSWQLESTSNQEIKQKLKFTLKVDLKVKRVFFDDGTNVKEFEEMAGQPTSHRDFNVATNVTVLMSRVNETFSRPIEIELHYELIKKIPDSEDFCEDCVAINPKDAKYSTQEITFITGCKGEVCVSDLQLSSSGFRSPFILGSNQTQTMTYTIRNIGEKSYLAQLEITTSYQMPFAKIPPFCKSNDKKLLCEVSKGKPMMDGQEEKVEVTFDTSHLEGSQVIIEAKAINTGQELNTKDNFKRDTMNLTEHTEIVILAKSAPSLTLNNEQRTEKITNVIEIRNSGPSTIKDMDVLLYIPVSYLVPGTQTRIQVINFENITIVGMHCNRTMETKFRQNNRTIVQESSLDDDIIESDWESQNVISTKKKRSVEIDDTSALLNNTGTIVKKSLSESLPVNQTILFNCDTSIESCIQAEVSISNFEPGDNVIRITITYNVDLNQINKILTKSKTHFVLTTLVNISKSGDEEGKTIQVFKNNPEIIFDKIEAKPTPKWVIILSVIAGLLLVTLMTYAFYRMGFFRRAKREQLAKLVRQSKLISVD